MTTQVGTWHLQQDNAAGYGYPPINFASLPDLGLIAGWVMVASYLGVNPRLPKPPALFSSVTFYRNTP